MALKNKPLDSAAILFREIEIEGLLIGPATRMLMLQSDPQGGIYYQFEKRKAQILHLTAEQAMLRFAVIDLGEAALLLDPVTNRLVALSATMANGMRTFLFGRQWGKWIDEEIREHDSPNPVEVIQSLRIPIVISETRGTFSADFLINIYHRQIYSRETVTAFREGNVYHSLRLSFNYPSGQFFRSRVTIYDADTNRMLNIYDVDGFPLVWPVTPNAPQPAQPPPPGQRRPAAPQVRSAAAGGGRATG
ncbi:MAG: hypothetical protein M1457_07525, partial [bacterium]|nr:hypothetical protein [bacterium]